ncbi:hypothetical protein KUBF_10470 [Bacteroides finegoldii]|nr:hypothetical protein KUBF_10470 [Bacteroides finegoldii]
MHPFPERSVSNYGKDKVTTGQLFDRVDGWLSNFEVQMNEDRERIRRLKAKVISRWRCTPTSDC